MATGRHGDLEQAGLRFQIGIFEEALRDTPNDTEALRFLSHGYAAVGRLEDGLAVDRKLAELLPSDERVRYNLACSLSLTGREDDALAALAEAIELGFLDLKLARRDRDLDPLRGDPRFDEILQRLARRLGE